MKLLVTFSLAVILLNQLCVALDDTSVDKRFPIFNLFEEKGAKIVVTFLETYCQAYSDFLTEFNETIADAKALNISGDYKGYVSAIHEFFIDFENFKANSDDCDLNEIAISKAKYILDYEPILANGEQISVDSLQMSFRLIKTSRAMFMEIGDEIPAAIISFEKDLDEEDKIKYHNILIKLRDYSHAQNEKEKYMVKLFDIVEEYTGKGRLSGDRCSPKDSLTIAKVLYAMYLTKDELEAKYGHGDDPHIKKFVEEYLKYVLN